VALFLPFGATTSYTSLALCPLGSVSTDRTLGLCFQTGLIVTRTGNIKREGQQEGRLPTYLATTNITLSNTDS
jgi:hypothetical protein